MRPELNKPLSVSYRSSESPSHSVWSPDYGSNLRKGHFPDCSACCDVIHVFCVPHAIWGCLQKAILNVTSESFISPESWCQKKQELHPLIHCPISIPHNIWLHFPHPSPDINSVYEEGGRTARHPWEHISPYSCKWLYGPGLQFSPKEAMQIGMWRPEVELWNVYEAAGK